MGFVSGHPCSTCDMLPALMRTAHGPACCTVCGVLFIIWLHCQRLRQPCNTVPALQVRLEAMDRVVALAQDSSAADNTATLVQSMAYLPSWDEKNFQVRPDQHMSKHSSSPAEQPQDMWSQCCGWATENLENLDIGCWITASAGLCCDFDVLCAVVQADMVVAVGPSGDGQAV